MSRKRDASFIADVFEGYAPLGKKAAHSPDIDSPWGPEDEGCRCRARRGGAGR